MIQARGISEKKGRKGSRAIPEQTSTGLLPGCVVAGKKSYRKAGSRAKAISVHSAAMSQGPGLKEDY
jgi:hypothetical protein